MRGIKILLAILITVSVQTFSQTEDTASIELELTGIAQQVLNSIALGDTSVWNKYFLDNSIFITEEGKTNTKQEMIASIAPLPKGFSGSIKITQPTFLMYNGTAVLNYVAREQERIFNQEINTEYRISETYVYTTEGWRILSSQVFEIPAHPDPVQADSVIIIGYQGVYALGDNLTYEVSFSDGKLFGQRNGKSKEELFAENNNTFFTVSDTRGVKIFSKNKDDNTLVMIARRNGKDVIWRKK